MSRFKRSESLDFSSSCANRPSTSKLVRAAMLVLCLGFSSVSNAALSKVELPSVGLPNAGLLNNGLWPKFPLPNFPLPGSIFSPNQNATPVDTKSTPAGNLFVPSDYDSNKSYPLVVVLHGCLQSALDIAKSTRFNELAEKNKFVVLYPEQSRSANSFRCWNWFDTRHQGRKGESALIVEGVDLIKSEYNIDDSRVFIVGFSAGGGLASVLINCYRDVFAKAAIHSGLSYLAARSSVEAFPAMNTGSQISPARAGRAGYECGPSASRNRPSVFVIHGSRDSTVTPKFITQNPEQLRVFHDFLDDGENNMSLSVLDSNSSSGEASGYSFEMSTEEYSDFKLQTLFVKGLSHAWSGGAAGQQYSDPKGPNATELIWNFFTDDQ